MDVGLHNRMSKAINGVIHRASTDTPDSLFRSAVGRTTGVQLLRFGAVGTMNAAVDFGVLNLLMFFTDIASGIYLATFKGLSFAIAATNSYFWNKFWTFQSDSRRNNAEYIRFMSVTTCGLLINVAITSLIVNAIDPVFNMSPRLWVNFAALVAAGASGVWDFSWYKLVIFRRNLKAQSGCSQ